MGTLVKKGLSQMATDFHPNSDKMKGDRSRDAEVPNTVFLQDVRNIQIVVFLVSGSISVTLCKIT